MDPERYERYRQLRDQGVPHLEAYRRASAQQSTQAEQPVAAADDRREAGGEREFDQGKYSAYARLRQQGLSHEDAYERSGSMIQGERAFMEQAPTLSRVRAAATRNALQAIADYAGLAGGAMEGLQRLGRIQRPAMRPEDEPRGEEGGGLRGRLTRALKDLPERARSFLSGFEPLEPGAPEVVGTIAGRGAVDIPAAIGTGAAARSAPLVGPTLRRLAQSGPLGAAASTFAANVPVDVAQSKIYDEGLFLPGERGALAENLLLSGAASGIEGVFAGRRAAQEAQRRAQETQRRARDAARRSVDAELQFEPAGERFDPFTAATEAAAARRAEETSELIDEGRTLPPGRYDMPSGAVPVERRLTEKSSAPRLVRDRSPLPPGASRDILQERGYTYPIGPQPKDPYIMGPIGSTSTQPAAEAAGEARRLPMARESRVLPSVEPTGPRAGEAAQVRLGAGDLEPQRNVRKTGPSRAGENVAVSGDGSRQVPVVYRVVEADDLVASNNPFTFSPEPEYPAGVQGRRRQYETKPTQDIVIQQAAGLDPVRALNPTVSMLEGPPVVSPNGIVLAGNNRAMSIKRSAAEFPQVYSGYRNALTRQAAERFGISPEEFAGMKNPVLVREVVPEGEGLTVGQMGDINRASDVPSTKAKRPQDMAAEKAESLRGDEGLMGFFADNMDPDETLVSFLDKPEGRSFVDMLIERGVFNQSEIPLILTDAGRLSPDGKSTVRRMVLAAAFDNFDDFTPAILKKLEPSSPQIATLRGTEGDLSEVVNRAALALREASDNNLTIEELADQASLFGESALPDNVVNMAKYLLEKNQREITQNFREYTGSVLSSSRASREGAGLFGEEVAESLTETPRQAAERIGLGRLYSFPGPVLQSLRTEGGQAVAGAALGAAGGAYIDEENPVSAAIMGGLAGRYAPSLLRATARGAKGLAQAARSGSILETIRPAPKVKTSELVSGAPVARGERSREARRRTWRQIFGDAYEDIFERNASILSLIGDLRGTSGIERMNENIARLDGSIQAGVVKANDEYGRWLKANRNNLDAIGNAAVILADFANRRAVSEAPGELAERGFKLTGYSNEKLTRAVAEILENEYLVERTKELQGFFRDILRRRAEAGIISPEEFARIEASTEYYTPLYKDFTEMSEGISSGVRGPRVKPQSGVRKMDRELSRSGAVQDPMEVLIGERIALESDLAKQEIINQLAEAIGKDGIEGLIRPLGPGIKQQAGSRTFSVKVGGKRVTYEVLDERLWNSIEQSRAYAAPILSAIADIKRGSIVLPPDFSVMALMRDIPMYAIQRDAKQVAREALVGGIVGGATGGLAADDDNKIAGIIAGAGIGSGIAANIRAAYEISEGLIHAARGTEQYRDFLRAGASSAGVAVTDPKDIRKLLGSMTEQERRSILNFSNIGDALKFVGAVAENAPRFAAWRKTGSAWEAQRVTVPFARIGASETLQKLAGATPFLGATLQGWRRLAELTFGEGNKLNTLVGSGMAIAAPSVGLWMLNKDNEEYWKRPLWERNMYWLIPGWVVGSDDEFKRIPKAHQLGMLYGSMPERVLDAMARAGIIESAAPEGMGATDEIAASIVDFTKQNIAGTVPVPAAIQAPLERITNYDLFRGRQITPDYIAQRDPELQYRESTSDIARLLGRLQDFATPIEIDQSIESTFGTGGKRALELADILVGAVSDGGPTPLETTGERLQEILGLRRFSSQDYSVSQPEYDAGEILREAERANAGVNQLIRERAPRDRIAGYRRNNIELIRLFNATERERSALEDLRERRNLILSSSTMSSERKRELLDELEDVGVRISEGVFRKARSVR